MRVRYLIKLNHPCPKRWGWRQKFNIVSTNICFNLIGVDSSDDFEVTSFSKASTIRISHDPIFLVFLDAPAYNCCGVCQVINLIFSTYLHIGENAFSEVWGWCREGPRNIDHAILQDLLLDASLRWLNKVSLSDSGDLSAWTELARHILLVVGRAGLLDEPSIFGEVAIHLTPSSLAALGHVIARDQLLDGEVRHWIDSMFHSQPVFNGLDESMGVARPATPLVPHFPCVVNTAHVPQIERCRDRRVRDIWCLRVIGKLVDDLVSGLQLLMGNWGLNKLLRLGLACIFLVHGVVFREPARIGAPSKLIFVVIYPH